MSKKGGHPHHNVMGETEQTMATIREMVDEGGMMLGSGMLEHGIHDVRSANARRSRHLDGNANYLRGLEANDESEAAAISAINAYRLHCLRNTKDYVIRLITLDICILIAVAAIIGIACISVKTGSHIEEAPPAHEPLFGGSTSSSSYRLDSPSDSL
jgi:hypothetical protein